MASAETARAITPQGARKKSARDPSIDYLRACVVVLVLVAHCGLAYSNTFRPSPWNGLSPVIDPSGASAIFDYIFHFDDVCLMALMFFISALFAWPSLERHGVGTFLQDRFLRIGLPFLGAIVVLMPIAYYASYQLAYQDGRYATYWLSLARHRFGAVGPAWFLWVLLVLDCMLAALYVVGRARFAAVHPERLENRPALTALVLFVVCSAVFLPLFAMGGFQYGGWHFIVSPFMFQPSRFPMYFIWCVTGFVVGIAGLEHGLIARAGALVRHWRLWVLAGLVSYNALWLVPRFELLAGLSPMARGVSMGLLWVAANVLCILGLLALFRGVVRHRHPVFDSLARAAYVIYLVHYIYVLWSQRLLLHVHMPVVGKFAVCFTITLALSWLTSMVLTRVPGLRRVL